MERLKLYLTATNAALLLSLLGTLCLVYGLTNPADVDDKYPSKSIISAVPTVTEIKAYITGAVKQPGVYILKQDDRVSDLILKAGGLTEQANQEYLSKKLNLAQKVTDGYKVYIPTSNENSYLNSEISSPSGSDATNSLISLNSASTAELDQLPGVGAVTATKIINSRPYTAVSELLNKQIVNKSVYEKIKDLITIN